VERRRDPMGDKKPQKTKKSKDKTKGVKGGATPSPEEPIEQKKSKK
jgi:hypothetical protein